MDDVSVDNLSVDNLSVNDLSACRCVDCFIVLPGLHKGSKLSARGGGGGRLAGTCTRRRFVCRARGLFCPERHAAHVCARVADAKKSFGSPADFCRVVGVESVR